MQDAEYSCRACFPNDGAGIVLRITRVHDDREIRFAGNRNLSRKGPALRFTRTIIVVVVEAALSDSDGTIAQKAFESRKIGPCVESRSIVRVNPGCRKHEARIIGRDRGGRRRCVEGFPDADHCDRARRAGAGNYLVAVAGERRVREVGVAVDEDRRASVLRGHLRSIQSRTGAAT